MSKSKPSPAAVPLDHQPEFSRRVARLKSYPPLDDLTLEQRRAFTAAIQTITSEEDLAPEHQRWIREAEAAQRGGAR